MEKISYTKPSITRLEIDYANDAVTNGWGEKCYQYIDRFEREFAAYIGCKHAIATSSCTGALHMGLAALNLEDGDEVIIADSNWIASVAPVVHLRARPVFVDIDPVTWCISPAEVEKAITPKTKAIIAVHLYGNLCNMNSLKSIADKYEVALIEDSAEAIGSEYFEVKAGALGKFSTYSFHGTKTMTTGEGGMFLTNDSDLYDRVLTLSNHGRSKNQQKQFWPDDLGFKYKMSNVQAAIGCAQLSRIEDLVNKKRSVFNKYFSLLSELPIEMNPELDGHYNSYWMPTAVVDKKLGVTTERLIKLFQQKNIDARVFFSPLSSLPMFEKCNTPNAHDICQRAVNLPSFYDITDTEIETVCAVLKEAINE